MKNKKMWKYLLIAGIVISALFTFILINNQPKKVKALKNETDLVLEIRNSVISEYYNWHVNDNTVINFNKHVKIVYSDSLIEVFSLDKTNIKEDILVSLNYTTNSKEIKESYELLKSIQNQANITKIFNQLR
jgi:hypothetical protein